jgi:hypothetical protein
VVPSSSNSSWARLAEGMKQFDEMPERATLDGLLQ